MQGNSQEGERESEVSMTAAVRPMSERMIWMAPRREPYVTYATRVPASLDERITAMRLHSGESGAAYCLRALKAQLERDEAELKTQGPGEGQEEKR